MFRFFRNLRLRLLAENHVSKYLLYALGEIMLVVIGILIALQIDTWNEARKNRAFEKEVLAQIKENLLQDKLVLQGVSRSYREAVEASGKWPGRVVTELEPAATFWEAEDYHQDYLQKYPNGYTCHYVRPDWTLGDAAA